MSPTANRRQFLKKSFLASSLIVLSGPQALAANSSAKKEEVGPAEDLMREHGALNRILLIYEEGIRQLNDKKEFPIEVLQRSANLIHQFIEDYHEKLEEDFVFPRLQKAGKLTDLVSVLDRQHRAGRTVTSRIEKLAVRPTLKNDSDRNQLISSMESFIRMYRPHESREDTVVFPAFHKLLSEKEYDELGEKFEAQEHKLFGNEGFERIVQEISDLEKEVNLSDISLFTPKT